MDNGESSYRRYLDGDDEGLYEIVVSYMDGLVFYINGMTGNLHVAEELMQETFMKLIIKRPRFFGRSGFKTWLYSIARNLTIDHMRKNTTSVSLDEIENYVEDAGPLEDAYLKDERKTELRRAMSKLTVDQAQALRLVYFEEFSNADAAHIMKKTSTQFASLLYRAKKSLKSELEREGFVYEEL